MRSTYLLQTAGRFFAAIAIGMAATAGGPALAQVAPSAAEVAAYTGLHAAAQKGDVAKIDRLAAAKADLNARDGNGRTPLHVAALPASATPSRRWYATAPTLTCWTRTAMTA